MTDHVFVGPSLDAGEVRRLLPYAEIQPPIRHGDLLRLRAGAGDRVLIIDGLFMQSAPVRHREILAALDRGAVVAGSSSMGALRAAELWPHGMRGVGRVFELYRDGVITADDEVAVLYGPAEDGYPLLSRPLVDFRVSTSAAVDDGVLTRAQADALLARAAALPFRDRSFAALRHAWGDLADPYLRWAAGRMIDVKADDARALLAAAGADALAPPGPADRPIVNLATYVFERWTARHVGTTVAGRFVADADVVGVVRALHPALPELHRRDVLRALVGGDPTDEAVTSLARRRGLVDDAGLDPVALPYQCRASDPVSDVLVRALGPSVSPTLSLTHLPAELADEATLAVARHFARKAMAVNEHLPRPDPRWPERRMFFRADAVDDAMAAVWGVPVGDLEAGARDRGFRDLVRVRSIVEPFVGLLRLAGPPVFPAVGTVGNGRRSLATAGSQHGDRGANQ